jgi:gamma-glutamylcyclotransferase (GGCT)/AIG2-like uncharacterized protein YtfP
VFAGTHLFVYGTLLPGEVRWHLLEPYVADAGVRDDVGGSLFDTGLDYPAAVFGGSGTIRGMTFTLAADAVADCLAHLDVVEGTVDGLYARVRVTTGLGLEAWSYQYGGGLDLRPIASGDWLDRSGG